MSLSDATVMQLERDTAYEDLRKRRQASRCERGRFDKPRGRRVPELVGTSLASPALLGIKTRQSLPE